MSSSVSLRANKRRQAHAGSLRSVVSSPRPLASSTPRDPQQCPCSGSPCYWEFAHHRRPPWPESRTNQCRAAATCEYPKQRIFCSVLRRCSSRAMQHSRRLSPSSTVEHCSHTRSSCARHRRISRRDPSHRRGLRKPPPRASVPGADARPCQGATRRPPRQTMKMLAEDREGASARHRPTPEPFVIRSR